MLGATLYFSTRCKPFSRPVPSPAHMTGVPFHIVAHRGWRSECPENTLVAFTVAVQHGFLHFEADAQMTEDGTCVIFHDETIDRTTNSSGQLALVRLHLAEAMLARGMLNRIPRFSSCHFGHLSVISITNMKRLVWNVADVQMQYAEVEKLDAGSWFAEGFAGVCATEVQQCKNGSFIVRDDSVCFPVSGDLCSYVVHDEYSSLGEGSYNRLREHPRTSSEETSHAVRS